MSTSQTQINLATIEEPSCIPVDHVVYYTRTAVVSHLPGHRPRVLDSLNGPLTRTETHARLDISANERERSVGLSSLSDSPKQQQQAITPSDYSTQPGRSSQPRPTRRTTRKAAQKNGQPSQPKRFSNRLRDKVEKMRRELQQKLELEQKAQQVKRKVKKD